MKGKRIRFQQTGEFHFLTFSCYRRRGCLPASTAMDLFEDVLERVRRRYLFVVAGYVVMPEHVHLLVGEPSRPALSVALQVGKQQTSRKLKARAAVQFWQRRYYDFNVWSEARRVEKLRSMHRNPVKRGLAEKPEHCNSSTVTQVLDRGFTLTLCLRPHQPTSLFLSWAGGRVMSNEANSEIVQKEVETLSLVQRAQVGSAIGTGILALTYVSGYLTATSYLGTFGISADASELFRAKYIYIGFEYWLFVAIFGVCFYAANLLVRLCKVTKADEEDGNNERKLVTAELVRRRLSREALLERTRALRWGGVMALISVVFSFEILFMNSADFRDYLPIQAMFLLFLSLYQTTFYREYSKESYGWGVLWGVVWVRCIRWVYSIGFGVVFTVLLLLKAFRPGLSSDNKLCILFWVGLVFLFVPLLMLLWIKLRFLIAWIVVCSLLMLGAAPIPHLDSHAKLRALFGTMGIVLFLITLVVAFFVTLGSSHLKWADERAPKPERHWVVLMVMAPWYILLAVCHAFVGIKEMTRPEASTDQVESSGKQKIIAGALWIIRRLDSVFIPLLASGYCAIAYLVWMRMSIPFLTDNHLAIICGYCTLIVALVVLVNILLLSMKHGEREQDLKIQNGVLMELRLQAEIKSQGKTPVELPAPEPGWMRWARLIVPIGILYLVSVLGFANLIYPFIPVDKGGGNFSKTIPILIDLNNGSSECISAELPRTIQRGEQFYVIEQASDWLYVAPNDSGQGPDCWKWGIFCKKEKKALGAIPVGITAPAAGVLRAHLPYFRPEIHQVDRRCIASIDNAP